MLREARKILSKKINIPLKIKISALTSLLLLATVGFYLSYATAIFKEEKAADIYLISMSNSTNLSDKVEIISDKFLKMSQILANMNPTSVVEEIKKMTSIHQDLLGASCVIKSDENNIFSYYQETSESSVDHLNIIINKDLINLRSIPIGYVQLERSNLPPFFNHFILNIKKDNYACAMHLSLDTLAELNQKTDQLESSIMNNEGKVFFNVSRKTNFDEQTQKFYAQNMKSKSGVFKYKHADRTKIVAYSKIPSFDLYALTEIPEEKAFLASELLIKKSIYFGIAILSFALMFGILFSNSLTGALTYLTNAANSIAEGDFNSPIDHSKATNDEIGFLNYTFENMRQKIVAYMEEMKEKYRLENEVKVAQIVQSSFFPNSSIDLYNTNLFGSYAPASECGGDWWGYLVQGKKITVIICDATGHGVPAALLTAAAHSTVSNLKLESKVRHISPREVLTRLNQVVSLMNSTVQLTGFAFELDSENGNYTYANASHQPALIFSKNSENKYTKNEIIPLQEGTGKRIGENFESEYYEFSGQLNDNDFVILYTDGILEFENNGKSFGQRNFFKYILEALNNECQNAKTLTVNFMSAFREFQGQTSLQDDISFLALSFTKTKNTLNKLIEINKHEDIQNLTSSDGFIISSLSNSDNIKSLLLPKITNHLIGKNSLSISDEIDTITYLMDNKQSNENLFYHIFLESNDQITMVTNEVINAIEQKKVNKINASTISFTIEELLSNAFYHSIYNPDQNRGGQIIYTSSPVELKIECTEKYFSIYVESENLNPGIDNILNSIHRGQIEKTPRQGGGGAGLGLYLVYERSHQFWIIEKNNKLGFRIVFERFNRNIQSEERITSYHYIKLS